MDRRRRRHQHELPVLAAGAHRAQPPGPPVCRGRVPVRQRVDAGCAHRQDRQPLRRLHGHQDVSACGRDLHGQRVLGEGRFAACTPIRPERKICRIRRSHETTSCPATSTDWAMRRRWAAASSCRIRSTRRRCSARCSSPWTNGQPRARPRRQARCRSCRTERWCGRSRNWVRAFPTFRASPTTASKRPATCSTTDQISTRPAFRPSTRRRSRRRIRTIRRTARSIRASCPAPTATATTLPGCGCRT